jgi:toxin HigB-1
VPDRLKTQGVGPLGGRWLKTEPCKTGAVPVLPQQGESLPRLITVDVNNERRYHSSMITDFKCADTQAMMQGKRVARFANIEAVAMRKLVQLNAATALDFLRVPPGNRLEALQGDRKGQHSIRINDQWRVCFVWADGNAAQVEIVDYH